MKPSSPTIRKVLVNPAVWLVILLLLAALLRLVDVTDEPLELHPTRQFRALIIARAFYYPTAADIPAKDADFAEQQASQVGLIEPSILEFLTAQAYRLAGKEITWLGRIFPIAAWLLGGLAVYFIARQLSSTLGAFISLVYFLFLPFGARFSRVLMADPLMVAGIAASLWALYNWERRRDLKSALLAGMLTGITILLKSIAGIILIFPFAAFILSSFTIKETLKNKQIWLILLLAGLPTAAYYYYGLVIDGRLATQFKGRFFPEIWTDLVFYKSWGLRIIREFNILAFFAGLFGIALAKTKQIRWMLFGWWAGYFIYGMLFAYYTWTHDYYHLPMVPLIAVSLAPLIAYLETLAKKKNVFHLMKAATICVCLVLIVVGSYNTAQFLLTTDYRTTRTSLEQLGEDLQALPPGRIVGLTDDYETSFTFYNLMTTGHWPSTGDFHFRGLQGGSDQTFDQLWEIAESASYFFVTDFQELKKQPFLDERLSNYPIISEDEIYRLFSLSGQVP